MSSTDFRNYLYPEGHPRIEDLKGLDAYQYREVAKEDSFTGGLIQGWTPLYKSPFAGISNDGNVQPGLYDLSAVQHDERPPSAQMLSAANALLDLLDVEQHQQVSYPVAAPEWQVWANPEFMQFDNGLRMESLPPGVRQAILDLVRASLSDYGFEMVSNMMRINGFLGDVVGLQGIMNEFSYNFSLFGVPQESQPWGWQLYGHHCAVNCMLVGETLTLSPVFLGAEPNVIDEGKFKGTTSFTNHISASRALLQSLPEDLRQQATIYSHMIDERMPEGRVHPGDERHLAGAFQDNRVIPYEGIRFSQMSAASVELATELIEHFVGMLPDGPRRARIREVRKHYDETYFSWIGGHGVDDVFYWRIQSPVAIFELDHHCGVFLDYDEPQGFHIHTVMRTPNGNDYGRELLNQWQSRISSTKEHLDSEPVSHP